MNEVKSETYTVTDRAGKRVAGRFVKPGDELTLTAAEAEYGLGEGAIVRKGKQLSKAFTGPDKGMDALRVEAAAFKAGAIEKAAAATTVAAPADAGQAADAGGGAPSTGA